MKRYDADIIIIGAGLLGCAVARSLCRYDLSVIVLEKAHDVSTGISKANSGIIYAGYDDDPGSLKAQMVVRASRRLPELCRELGVRYRQTGSIMAGFGPRAARVINRKYEQGLANGVPGIALLSGAEVLKREPLIASSVQIGLLAPGTATLDPWELCIALYENASAGGAEFHMGSAACDIRRTADGFEVDTDSRSYTARVVINCAGISAGCVREMCERPLIRIVPNASDYLVLGIARGEGPSHVIFHEPEYKGKGLTLIPTLHGEILAGSTQRDEPDLGGNPSDEAGLRRIIKLCREVVPDMPISPALHTFAANRPNPFELREKDDGCGEYEYTGRRMKDFIILEENGLYSLMGIKTPGLTCCVELGEHIAGRAAAFIAETRGGDIRTNAAFDPRRRDMLRFADMPAGSRDELISQHPDAGRIICSCRQVSEHEIREAVRRGATTLDGVKRRTGVMMGRCQGSKCLGRILGIMADEMGIPKNRII